MQQLMRLPQVEQATGLRRSSLYAAIARGEFPRPIPLSEGGRSVAWSSSEVSDWIDARIQARERDNGAGRASVVRHAVEGAKRKRELAGVR